jgi:hypothetical protein
MAAAEARWRAEHERRMEIVLQNAVNMVKGQLGAVSGNHLPAVNPAVPTRNEPKEERASEAEPAEKSTVTRLRAVVAA